MPTGIAIINFGAQPLSEASVDVTGQTTITTESYVEAWVMVEDTVDTTVSNTITDHKFAAVSFKLTCGHISNGVGFTIFATSTAGECSGTFSIRWVYT